MNTLVHPAVVTLLRYQAVARTARLAARMATPRRLVLSLLAIALAVLWLGNALAAVLLRGPLDREMLQRYLPLSLAAYAVWHVIKVAYERPPAGVEWTAAEEELLCARPFRRRDLLLYRFATIASSALLKAALMTLFLMPDFPLPWAGFLGALLGLLLLDLLRMAVEIVAWGIPDSMYRRLQTGVFVSLAIAAGAGLLIAIRSPTANADLQSAGSLRLAYAALQSVSRLGDTALGSAVTAPFAVFAHVMLAPRCDAVLLAWLSTAAGLVIGAALLVLCLDRAFLAITLRREQNAYAAVRRTTEEADVASKPTRLAPVPHWLGAGPILWRQLLGVRRYGTNLAVALAVPAALSCLPWLAGMEGRQTLWNVAAGLAFYSFLLLPPALRFDFRRELERMVLLKSLPIRPAAMVAAQLATPVAVAALLQTAVIALTALVFRVDPWTAAAAVLLLAAMNVLVFALDNLIYLWFPHRLNQEGIVVFLRTTLTFTAKGLLFAAALAVVLGWALSAAWLDTHCGVPRSVIFLGGLLGLFGLFAAALLALLIRAYSRFDPSQDIPG